MTSLDELDLFSKPSDIVVEREPRKCRRHEWVRDTIDAAAEYPTHIYVCARCHALRDETRARRGKSSRRLGHDGERRSEKRYGWAKVGEFGGITDLQGTLAIVQQKTSRRAPPVAWMSIFRALEARAGGRIPLILHSFVRQGTPTTDFVIIRGEDWLALHGKDSPNDQT